MRKTIHFTKASWNENGMELHAETSVKMTGIQAAGQMIVDSDATAFVYLAEENNEFMYLYIHETVWGDLQKALEEEARLFAAGEDENLELISWAEELAYLVSNIEGNSNYGEKMVERVEAVFFREQ
ncbi:hypothetical protein QYG89_08975 [Bacillus sp. B190/17]|uniref:Uncharacterized protein n=1 Tax=Bacillus lumedeiriae TaxID=3058829 RepID=A0ABW8IAW9_9BACI